MRSTEYWTTLHILSPNGRGLKAVRKLKVLYTRPCTLDDLVCGAPSTTEMV